ncbi:hypothetical protein [Acerihabitans arboris]|uniref:Uncharacterized protein n=1 Tax=Acerihabitans arboris TaxID=2691583 RepID=A0A845SGT9_9GAMM|nr:hypothetical protein [Acerihabitans arboris]NDL62537.1 hypothetical protein [Acerihabitans arboris]
MNIWKFAIWPSLTVLAVIVAWVLINGDKAVDNIDKFKKWYGSSPAITGIWDNSTEYDIDPPKWLTDQHEYMRIEMTVEDSKVDGIIATEKLQKALPFEFVLLSGDKKSFRDEIEAVAFDYIMGKKVIFGTLNIKVKDGVLIVKKTSSNGGYFPDEARLAKKSEIAFPEQQKKPNEK